MLLRKAGYNFHTSAEREIVRSIKEQTCYVALNPQKEEDVEKTSPMQYRLPDGEMLTVATAV